MEQATGKLSGLAPKQQKAIGLILAGCSLADVAKRVEVSRGTIHHWTRRSGKFIAALENWRSDMERTTRARLLGLSALGFKAIHRALEAGDAKLALQLFKGLGVIAKEKTGADEPETKVIRVSASMAEARRRTGDAAAE
jgi:AcrR family transcriptional regulator